MNSTSRQTSKDLRDLALLFLKLGTIGFGGPATHIALMEEEVVRKRKWLSENQFLDLLGATNLIPGPNSTEMAIHIGRERAGFLGLLTAGVCFILPAMTIVLAVAWTYSAYGKLVQAQSLLSGVKPVIVAIIAQAVWNLTRKTMSTGPLLLIATLSMALSLRGHSELIVLFGMGFLMLLTQFLRRPKRGAPIGAILLVGWIFRIEFLAWASAGAPLIVAFSDERLFLFFLQVGSLLYGSGYVLLAFLQGTLVDQYGWLTQSQLLDATAVGQFTPGPVFTTATFIGYLLSGVRGALVATLGIFLPSFFFVAVSARLIPRIRSSNLAGAFLDGVNAASLGLMAAVAISIGMATYVNNMSVALGLVSGFALVRLKMNSSWLILAGGTIGLLMM